MDIVIIGAGPAGLTAAYLLSKKNMPSIVLESDPVYVGGLSKTVEYKGFHFDIGGHRFFSKSKQVEDLWTELLGDDMLVRNRKSRIYYNRKFFSYPLKAFQALWNLGIFESILCVLSYFQSRVFPYKDPKNFEQWVSNKFGKRLFSIFFKTYTEKVWGMACSEISADWAAQRIKKLSLGEAIINSLFPKKKKGDSSEVITTLIDSFRYPKKGPGMMWDAAAKFVRNNKGDIRMGAHVVGIEYNADNAKWKVSYKQNDELIHIECDHVISSAPLKEIMMNVQPPAATEVIKAASNLRYRDFIIVSIMLKDRHLFDDNWIYIHDPSVKVGRVENFKAWSPFMVPDPATVCFGLEYFCFEGDGLWESSDEALVELGKKELLQLGLAKKEDFLDGCVLRQKKAYPVYDDFYSKNVDIIRAELSAKYPNLHLIGRNGMHKYNNQDHAMVTAMFTVENICAGKNEYDVWRVNEDAVYLEAGDTGAEDADQEIGTRLTPKKVK